MLLTILQCTGQLPKQRIILPKGSVALRVRNPDPSILPVGRPGLREGNGVAQGHTVSQVPFCVQMGSCPAFCLFHNGLTRQAYP